MRVTVLMENTTCRPDLSCEHGLSLYIDANGRRILFDAGQTEAFADNAALLGMDLQSVDLAILSHGHYDHSGGLLRFLQENDHAPVYMHRAAPEPHWHGPEKNIGIDPALMDTGRIVMTGDAFDLAEGLRLCSCNGLPMPYAPSFGGLQVKRGLQLLPDDFRHEQYLIIQEGERRIVVSGCSHKGAMNLMHWLRPDVLIGGFHFVQMDPQGEELSAAARAMAALNGRYYTGHCTGQEQFATLKNVLGDSISYLSTGMSFEI